MFVTEARGADRKIRTTHPTTLQSGEPESDSDFCGQGANVLLVSLRVLTVTS